jgi:hypothetical protein
MNSGGMDRGGATATVSCMWAPAVSLATTASEPEHVNMAPAPSEVVWRLRGADRASAERIARASLLLQRSQAQAFVSPNHRMAT